MVRNGTSRSSTVPATDPASKAVLRSDAGLFLRVWIFLEFSSAAVSAIFAGPFRVK